MLYTEIIAVCSQIHTGHINRPCGQNIEFVNVKPGGLRVFWCETPCRWTNSCRRFNDCNDFFMKGCNIFIFKGPRRRSHHNLSQRPTTSPTTQHHNPEDINPLNPKLIPICHLLALLGAHHFLHVSRIRVKL